MTRHYAVSDGQRTFAFVHAADSADAIRIACAKASGHDPATCTATAISTDDGGGRRSAGRFGHADADND